MTERAEDVVNALQEAVRVHMLAEMPADDGRLAAMGFATLMIEYRTWRGRFVEPRPRRVHRAPSLQPTTLSAELAAVVDALQADLEHSVETKAVSVRASGDLEVCAPRLCTGPPCGSPACERARW